MNRNKHKLSRSDIAAALALVMIAIGLGVLLIWSFERADVLAIKEKPVRITPVKVSKSSEDKVIVHIDYCKYTNQIRTEPG